MSTDKLRHTAEEAAAIEVIAHEPEMAAAIEVIEGFKAHYARWYPEKGPDALWDEHVVHMLTDQSCSGEEMLQALRGEPREYTALHLFLIGVALAAKAVQTSHKGSPADAWPLVVQAAYINGKLSGFNPGARAVLTQDMIVREMGRRGGKAAQVESNAMSDEVRAWCEQRLSEYPSLNKLCDGVIKARLNAAKWGTVRSWLTEWAIDWRAKGLWSH